MKDNSTADFSMCELARQAGVGFATPFNHFGSMSDSFRCVALLLSLIVFAKTAHAQMPFYTDDTSVTDPKTLHIEVFDEIDGLQSSQFPDFRQNTADVKLNFSPLRNVELDIDTPYISIDRTAGVASSQGIGDTNLGVKWNFRQTPKDSLSPALAVSLYIEFPTGNAQQELGSGLTDYALNFMLQKPLSAATRFNVDLGLLFAGNTSTGAVGIQTRRGQVYTGGFSLLHDVTPQLTVGGEIYGGIADDPGLDRTQLQAMVGLQYTIRNGLTLCLGILGGKYGATPRVGGQLGFAMDLPDLFGAR